jgi:hypothetical protein
MVVKYFLLLGSEVFSDDGNDADGREVTGSQREVCRGTA